VFSSERIPVPKVQQSPGPATSLARFHIPRTNSGVGLTMSDKRFREAAKPFSPSPQAYDQHSRPGDGQKARLHMNSAYQTVPVEQRRTRWSRSDDAYKSLKKSTCSPGAKYSLPDLWVKKSYHRPLQYLPLPKHPATTSVARRRKAKPVDACVLDDLSPESKKAVKKMSANEVSCFIKMKQELRSRNLSTKIGP